MYIIEITLTNVTDGYNTRYIAERTQNDGGWLVRGKAQAKVYKTEAGARRRLAQHPEALGRVVKISK